MKPGSAGPAMPGIHPVIYDEEGNEIPPGSNKAGNICGKIMRRVLAALSNQSDKVGDITTLMNAEVVDQIKQMVLSR
jgi:acyl-coenzyme A synthetase/AMP-(fatty) acid ligase